jgi:hypothetical protein
MNALLKLLFIILFGGYVGGCIIITTSELLEGSMGLGYMFIAFPLCAIAGICIGKSVAD